MKNRSIAIVAGTAFWLLQQNYQFSLLGITALSTVVAGLAGLSIYRSDFRGPAPVDKVQIAKDVVILLAYFLLGYVPLELTRRLLFHPLASYPGPIFAKLSRFWYSSFLIGGQTPYAIRKLHQKHGDIIRIAPDEVSINNADWIVKVLGDEAALAKGPDYLGLFHADDLQLQGIQDFAVHKIRREYWNKGFTAKALDSWQIVNAKHASTLVEALKTKAKAGRPLDIGSYCSWYASDAGSELAYSQSVNQIPAGKADVVSSLAFKALVIAAQKPWIEPLTKLVPSFRQLYTWTRERLDGPEKDDLFGYIIGENEPKEYNLTFAQQAAEARTILLAGSPTVGNAFAFAVQFLVESDLLGKVGEEVENVALSDRHKLAELPFLNAVINETLRLRPMVPSRTQRVVSDIGLVLPDGRVVPRGTFLGLPFYTVQRDPRYFSPGPDEFRPMRWLESEKEEHFERKAYFPFSHGPYNCVGKPLALDQLRTGVAAIAQNFKVSFSKDYSKAKYEKAIKDQFTFQMGQLSVLVVER